MANNSSIEWTDASWNCLSGCEAVSPGCAHCYAATMTRRLEAMGQADYTGLTTAKHFNGTVRCLPHKLDVPLRWRKPRRVFVNSMSDLFHEDVPDEFIDRVFAVMALSYWHTFQVLTKRAKRMAAYFANQQERIKAIWNAMGSTPDGYCRTEKFPPVRPTLFDCVDRVRGYDKNWPWSRGMCGYFATPPWPLYNVWLGISAERQQEADERIPWLLKTPAAVRFVSAEPLLGPIDLHLECPGCALCATWRDGKDREGRQCYDEGPALDWIIVGGESGHGARPCNVAWIRSIVQQCQAAGVACFVKQLGKPQTTLRAMHEFAEWREICHQISGTGDGAIVEARLKDRKGGDPAEWPVDLRVRQMPKPLQGA